MCVYLSQLTFETCIKSIVAAYSIQNIDDFIKSMICGLSRAVTDGLYIKTTDTLTVNKGPKPPYC